MSTSSRLDHLRARYLSQWTTHTYKMIHGAFFVNHLLHAIVALTDLGASDQQISAFAERYTKDLVRVDVCDVKGEVDAVVAPLATLSWAEAEPLLGKRQQFDELRGFYEGEVAKLGTDGAVMKHLPVLSDGLAGSLVHGLIQLGYAYYLGGELPVAEGLTFMHFTYLRYVNDDASRNQQDQPDDQEPVAKRAFTKDAMLTLMQRVCRQEDLLAELHVHLQRESIKAMPLPPPQLSILSFSSDAADGNRVLFQAVASLVREFDLTDMNGKMALDFSLWLYASLPLSNFVMLHAVTGAWALQQVEHLLAPMEQTRAWGTWLRVTLSAYIGTEMAPIPDIDDVAIAAQQSELPSWTDLVTMALELPGEPNEHVFKVVQVAHAQAMPTNLAEDGEGSALPSFLTPTQREYVMKKAALKAITEPFAFSGRATP